MIYSGNTFHAQGLEFVSIAVIQIDVQGVLYVVPTIQINLCLNNRMIEEIDVWLNKKANKNQNR